MFNHASINYECPICLAVKRVESEDTWIKQEDVFYQDDFVMGFISSKFIKGNEGHLLIVPKEHFENIYDLPEEIGSQKFNVGKKLQLH